MALKPDTYLRFGGGADSLIALQSQTPGPSDAADTLVITMFLRILEWPVGVAPIIQAFGQLNFVHGIFLYANEFAKTGASRQGDNGEEGDQLCLGIQMGDDSQNPYVGTPTSAEDLFEMSNTGVPVELGSVLQVQIVHLGQGVGLLPVPTRVFVDTIGSTQRDMDCPLFDASASGMNFRVGGLPVHGWGTGAGSSVTVESERALFDLIQLRWEVGRTVSLSGSTILAPDGILDPFEELMVDGSATDVLSFSFFLDEGSGNPAVSDGGQPMLVAGVNLDWADPAEVDPLVNLVAKTATYNFDNLSGYPLRVADSPDLTLQPLFSPIASRPNPTAGELRLRTSPNLWSEHGRLRAVDWSSTLGLTGQDVGQVAFGYESLLAGESAERTAGSNVNPYVGFSALINPKSWTEGWFYDDMNMDVDTKLEILGLSGPQHSLGIEATVVLGNYVLMASPTDGRVDSGIARSLGWHRVSMYATGSLITGTVRSRALYLDRVLVATSTTGGDDPSATSLGIRSERDPGEGDGWVDRGSFNVLVGPNVPTDFQGLVSDSGSILLPLLQPAAEVSSFDSVVFDLGDALGTFTPTFRHSSTGPGGPYGPSTSLNDANLQALVTAADGNDVLEFTISMDSESDRLLSPVLRSMVIGWSVGSVGVLDHVRRVQMMGAGVY